MKKNMGKMDKLVRLIAALVIALLNYFGVISGLLGTILLGVAIIFILTSFVNFCPLYAIFGFNTCKVEEGSEK